MINNPVKVQTAKQPIENTREDMMLNDKDRATTKNFIYQTYQTDRQRIVNYNQY